MRLIDALIAAGDDLVTPRQVQHFCNFKNKAPAAEFALKAKELGFDARVLPNTNPKIARVSATRRDSVEFEHLHKITLELLDLAARFDGRYDAWECELVKGVS